MNTSRKSLNRLDFHPFITVGVNANGIIFYKSKLTERLCPNIRLGTKIERYTSVSLERSSILNDDFYGTKSTILVHKSEDEEGEYTILAVFTVSYYSLDENNEHVSSSLEELLSQDEAVCAPTEQYSLLRQIQKFNDTFSKWRDFSDHYIEKCNFKLNNAVSAEGFISNLAHVVNNRLNIGVKIDYNDTVSESASKINGSIAIMILNFISFVITNSIDKSIKITLERENEMLMASFSFKSKLDVEGIYGFGGNSSALFTLLTGISLADKNDTRLKLLVENGLYTFTMGIPTDITSEFIFTSNEFSKEMIVNFLDILSRFIEA